MSTNNIFPNGYVKIYDGKTSELLFEGHNMILQDGKNFIRSVILAKLLGWNEIETNPPSVSYKNSLINYNFDGSFIVLGSNSDATREDGSYDNLKTETSGATVKVVKLESKDISYRN